MMIVYGDVDDDDDFDVDDAQPMTTMMMMMVGEMTMMIVHRCNNPIYHLHNQLHLYPPTGISIYSSLSFYPSTSSSSSSSSSS
jgi:hypothetical protein